MTQQARLRGLGLYLVPGRVLDPQRAVDEAITADAMGFESLWIGERPSGTKEVAVLAGAVAAVTSHALIATGLTGPLRHPLLTASMGTTLQGLSDHRFVLGIGRGWAPYWRAWGAPVPTLASLRDFADIVKRLWAGEHVSYDGPVGTFPDLWLEDRDPGPPPPIVLGTLGNEGLKMAGTHLDGVLLSPHLTVDAVRRQCALVRDSAAAAGRDPAALRIYAPVIVGADLDEETTTLKIAARAVTYFQIHGLGDMLVDVNRFEPQVLVDLRAHPKLAHLGKALADGQFHRADLVEVSRMIPQQWLEDSTALGTSAACVERLRDYLATGVDGLVIHATAPDELRGVAQRWSTE